MKDIRKPVQPYYLPQITASYKFISEQLTAMGIAHEPILVAASQLKPMQNEVDMNKIKSMLEVDDKEFKPVWVSENLKILDGHHRTAKEKFKKGKNAVIKAIRIDADEKDGCSLLKVIQDRWERNHPQKAAE